MFLESFLIEVCSYFQLQVFFFAADLPRLFWLISMPNSGELVCSWIDAAAYIQTYKVIAVADLYRIEELQLSLADVCALWFVAEGNEFSSE